MRVLLWLLVLLLLCGVGKPLLPSTEHLKEQFESTFHAQCDKYTFVQTWYRNLEAPSDRFFVFVYSENGLRNGGFGDRYGGIVSAAASALRFNRTLLIESVNGFDKLFQPYYYNPSGNKKLSDFRHAYVKSNWTTWTKYNISLSNNDNTEYDLWMCISNPHTMDKCGLDNGDVTHPIIKLRGNRAYMCKWCSKRDTVAYDELKKLGLCTEDEHENMWEEAGCMTRLAMWPTDTLWEEVEKELVIMAKKAIINSTKLDEIHLTQENVAGEHINNINFTTRIGVHFRCGDIAFTHPEKAHTSCIVNEQNEIELRRWGSPIDIGRCAMEMYNNMTHDTNDRYHNNVMRIRHRGYYRRLSHHVDNSVLLLVTSDYPGSSDQMQEYASFPITYIAPDSCHIERDGSEICNTNTVVYWFILSLSDIIITQTENQSPTSGYSRSAAIYGLKNNSVRSGVQCASSLPHVALSKKQSGNWICA